MSSPVAIHFVAAAEADAAGFAGRLTLILPAEGVLPSAQ